jgi:hypothetical protein
LPELAEFLAAGGGSKFRNDNEFLQFEAQRHNLFAEHRTL